MPFYDGGPMIRLITCLRRKESISHQEFRKYWDDATFAGLMDKAATVLKPVKHARCLSLQVGANIKIMESRGSDEPYDGIIEWWWESATQLAPLLNTSQAQSLILEIQAYQKQFADFDRSPSFFTEA